MASDGHSLPPTDTHFKSLNCDPHLFSLIVFNPTSFAKMFAMPHFATSDGHLFNILKADNSVLRLLLPLPCINRLHW